METEVNGNLTCLPRRHELHVTEAESLLHAINLFKSKK